MLNLSSVGLASADVLQAMARAAQLVWERMWAQLSETRALAVQANRDVAAFDRARDAAGALWGTGATVEVGEWQLRFLERSQTNTWRSASAAPAHAAIAALRAAFPEIVIPRSAPAPHVDLGRGFPWIGVGIALAVVVMLAVLWVVSTRH